MKKGFFTVLLLVSFIAEAILCIVLYNKLEDVKQDVVSVNACLKQGIDSRCSYTCDHRGFKH